MRSVLLLNVVIVLVATLPKFAWGTDGDLNDLKKGPWICLAKNEPDKFEVTGNGKYKVRFADSTKEQGRRTKIRGVSCAIPDENERWQPHAIK